MAWAAACLAFISMLPASLHGSFSPETAQVVRALNSPKPSAPGAEGLTQVDLREPAQQVAVIHYGFVRDSVNTPDYGLLRAAGYNGILFHAADAHLAEAIAAARAAGMGGVGIWGPASGDHPETFAHRVAALSALYRPSIVVAGVEFEGKGLPGSPQWEWSEDFANRFRGLVPNQPWAVMVSPNQDDFNYDAYSRRGAQVWPRTFGATYDTTFDPRAVIERLIANGVDPCLINPVLGPNQSGEGLSNYASYALDDFGGRFPVFVPGARHPCAGGRNSQELEQPAAPPERESKCRRLISLGQCCKRRGALRRVTELAAHRQWRARSRTDAAEAARVRPIPHDCTTGGTREIWAELVRQGRRFQVEVQLLDPAGEQLDYGRTKPFLVRTARS